MKHTVTFVPSGRGKAQCAADPQFPDGIHADATLRAGPECVIEFPYPAPECGFWRAECLVCGFTIGVTAAGRADDPRSVRVTCLPPTQRIREA